MLLSSGVAPALRNLVTRAAQSGVTLGFAALLALHQARLLPWSVELLCLAGFGVALQRAVRRRRRPPRRASIAALDFELAGLCAIAVVLGLSFLPGELRGSFSGSMYVFFVLTAALAKPPALLGAGALLIALQASAGRLGRALEGTADARDELRDGARRGLRAVLQRAPLRVTSRRGG